MCVCECVWVAISRSVLNCGRCCGWDYLFFSLSLPFFDSRSFGPMNTGVSWLPKILDSRTCKSERFVVFFRTLFAILSISLHEVLFDYSRGSFFRVLIFRTTYAIYVWNFLFRFRLIWFFRARLFCYSKASDDQFDLRTRIVMNVRRNSLMNRNSICSSKSWT